MNKILEEKHGGSKQHPIEEKRFKSKSVSLVDFGARIKLAVSQAQGRSRIVLEVTFRQDYEIHNETIGHLRMLYGNSVSYSRLDDKNRAVISVIVDDAIAHFESPHSCAMSLSKIRVQVAGAPIWNALCRMDDQRGSQTSNEEVIYKLGTHGKCGSYYCISTNEK